MRRKHKTMHPLLSIVYDIACMVEDAFNHLEEASRPKKLKPARARAKR